MSLRGVKLGWRVALTVDRKLEMKVEVRSVKGLGS